MKSEKILRITLCAYILLSSFLMANLWMEMNSLKEWNQNLKGLVNKLIKENQALRKNLQIHEIPINYSDSWTIGKTWDGLYYAENGFGQRVYFVSSQEALEYAIAHSKDVITIKLKTTIFLDNPPLNLKPNDLTKSITITKEPNNDP